jgi:hypothetical protein
MDSITLEHLDKEIQQLTLSEQVWLMERLAHSIRSKTERQEHLIETQLAAMAADPNIQREITNIQREFASTESDGLSDDV